MPKYGAILSFSSAGGAGVSDRWTWKVELPHGVTAQHATIRIGGEYAGVWSLGHNPQFIVDALNEKEQREWEREEEEVAALLGALTTVELD